MKEKSLIKNHVFFYVGRFSEIVNVSVDFIMVVSILLVMFFVWLYAPYLFFRRFQVPFYVICMLLIMIFSRGFVRGVVGFFKFLRRLGELEV